MRRPTATSTALADPASDHVPVFHGPRIIAVGACAQALGMALMAAYGFMLTPLIEEFGASKAQLGLGGVIPIAIVALSGPLLGPRLDRGSFRGIMLAGVTLMLVSVLALSRAQALWQLALCYALAACGLAMYSMFPVHVMIVNWFVVRRGRAMALAVMGLSIGTFVHPPVIAWLFDQLGWRTGLAVFATGAALIVGPLIAAFAVRRPEDVGQYPDGIPPIEAAPAAQGPATEGAASLLRDANFWWVGVGVALAQCVSVATGVFFIRYLEELGLPRGRAALVWSSVAGFAMLGKLLIGWLVDRVDGRWVVLACNLLHAAGLVIAVTHSSFTAMLAAAVPMGLGAGGFLPLGPVLQGLCFGRERMGQVAGMHGFLGMPFMLGSTPLVGWLAARNGGFTEAFLALAGALLASAAVLAFMRVPGPSHALP